jgi:glycosyltransferase involved in cell wall biosynthesis
MLEQPLVSFIIPYFNAGDTIYETIDSIKNQNYSHYDIWIVNDGSSDELSINILKKIESESAVRVISIENSGPGIARNIAIKLTNAEYIFPIDADDKVTADAVTESLKEMKSNHNIGVVFGNGRFCYQRSGIKYQYVPDKWSLFIINPIANAALIRREVFEDVGYYDESLSKPGLEDWEFWLRVFYSKWQFKHINKVHFEIRVQDTSRTFQVANKNLDFIYSYVFSKHSKLMYQSYSSLYYSNKQLNESIDMKIGRFILYPYRLLKKIFK